MSLAVVHLGHVTLTFVVSEKNSITINSTTMQIPFHKITRSTYNAFEFWTTREIVEEKIGVTYRCFWKQRRIVLIGNSFSIAKSKNWFYKLATQNKKQNTQITHRSMKRSRIWYYLCFYGILQTRLKHLWYSLWSMNAVII